MVRFRRFRLAACVTVMLPVLAIAGLNAAASFGGTPQSHVRQQARRFVRAHAAVAAQLPVLASAPGPADALPSKVMSGIGPLISGHSLTPSLSRLLGTSGASTAWVVPGSSEICLVANIGTGDYGFCGSAAGVSQQGLFGEIDGTFIALFPRSVQSVATNVGNGSGPTFTPGPDGAVVAPLAGALTGVRATDATGTVVTEVKRPKH